MERMITYPSLFEQELFYDEKKTVRINSVVIPRIQRPYAQGREDATSTNVRNKFLAEIFRVLSSEAEEILDLNFVYGTVVNQGGDGYALELLDGQQRITTLFLLHWYVAVRELDEQSTEYASVMAALARFSYETRSSSREFCRHLSCYKPSMDKCPSQIIKKARWYYKSYDKDSTISAMLVMLDAIHEEYQKLDSPVLYTKLDRLQFYILSLGQFDLSEELYVKMNARGLALSSFENFKADLLDYMSATETSEEKVLEFSTSLDTRWIDIFWNKENELFDTSYLSFFYRYFAARYILDHTEKTPEEIRKDDTIAFLYTDAEKSLEIDYWGFSRFATEIEFGKSLGIDYLQEASKVLDIILAHRKEIAESLSPVWAPDETTDFFYNKATKFEHTTLIVWTALLEYCRQQKEFDVNSLKQWIRIVTNIIENSNIDSLEPTTVTSRILSKMMELAAPLMAEGKTLHEALVDYDISGLVRRAVVEEITKCRFIASDPSWEAEFIAAESHPFLKGMIGFYLSDGLTIADFKTRTNVVLSMFDAGGITEDYKKNHTLIRAMVSQFTSWDELRNRYITETVDATKYLKNMIAGTPAIHELFRKVTSLPTYEAIIEALEGETVKEAEFNYNYPDPMWQRYVARSVERLRRDVGLYNWMARIENKRKCRVYYSNGFINVATPNAYYDRIVIDCDRAEIVKSLIADFGVEFEDKFQNNFHETDNVLCFRLNLTRDYSHGRLILHLGDDHNLYVSFRMLDKANLDKYKEVFGENITINHNDGNLINLDQCKYGFMDSYEDIKCIVSRVTTVLAQMNIQDAETTAIENPATE